MIDGLDADVVTLALAADIDAIAAKTGKIPADWQKRLPNNSSPYTSTIVFLVRKGNPKGIKDWDDLVKPGVAVDHAQPEDLRRRALELSRAPGPTALKKFGGDEAKAKEFVAAIYKNVPVLDTGARGSTTTFAQRGLGDVLIAWENEAFLALRGIRRRQVRDRRAVALDPGRAAGRGGRRNVDAKGTRKVAEAYLQFLYTPEAQEIIAKNYLSPARSRSRRQGRSRSDFPKIELVTVDEAFGGWAKAQTTHLRRRRRVRPDLEARAGQVSSPDLREPQRSALQGAERPARLRAVARLHAVLSRPRSC